MKRYVLFIIICILILTGCSDNTSDNTIVEEFSQGEQTIDDDNIYNDDDINIIKTYVIIMTNYQGKSDLADRLYKHIKDLNSLAKKGYLLKGYEEGMKALDLISKGYDETIERLKSFEEEGIKLYESQQEHLSKELEALKLIDEIFLKMKKEYLNAYDQIENFIKNDDIEYVDKYYFHEQNFYDMYLELSIIALKNRNLFFDKILDY